MNPRTAAGRRRRRLADAGVESPRVDAELLLAHVARASPAPACSPLDDVPDDGVARFAALVDQRADRVPLQHLTGRAPFRQLELAVGPGVFVPRPETELLVGWVLEQLAGARPRRWSSTWARAPARIALSIAHEHPGARVTAVERDPAPRLDPAQRRGPRGRRGHPGRGARRRHDRPRAAARRSTAPSTSSSPTRRTCPTGPGCRRRWPTTTRRWRCGAAPTVSTSSAGLLRTAARLLRPGAALGIEHADQQGDGAAGAGPVGRRLDRRRGPPRPGRPPPLHHRPPRRLRPGGDCCPVADLYDCSDPDGARRRPRRRRRGDRPGRAGAPADRHRLRRRRRRLHAVGRRPGCWPPRTAAATMPVPVLIARGVDPRRARRPTCRRSPTGWRRRSGRAG